MRLTAVGTYTYLDEREEELVLEVLRSGRLSMGTMQERFERSFADSLIALGMPVIIFGGLIGGVFLIGVLPAIGGRSSRTSRTAACSSSMRKAAWSR